MIYYIGSINGSKLFCDHLDGKRVILHVCSTGKVYIEADDGYLIKKYMESGRLNIFLKYLQKQGIKVISL